MIGGVVLLVFGINYLKGLDLLRKRNQWKPGDRVQGLRKTKPDV